MEDLILKGTEEAASSSHSILSQRHLLSHQPRSTKRQDAACPTPSLFGAVHIRLALSVKTLSSTPLATMLLLLLSIKSTWTHKFTFEKHRTTTYNNKHKITHHLPQRDNTSTRIHLQITRHQIDSNHEYLYQNSYSYRLSSHLWR